MKATFSVFLEKEFQLAHPQGSAVPGGSDELARGSRWLFGVGCCGPDGRSPHRCVQSHDTVNCHFSLA